MELFEPTLILILAIVGFIAGFVDAVAGGGGMLTVPALLSVGLPAHVALGTNKLAATFASSTAAFTYYRKRLFQPSHWKRAFFSTLVGAIIGAFFVDLASAEWLDKVLPIIILATALYTIFHKTPQAQNNDIPQPDSLSNNKQYSQGLILGFYSGFAGPGTGAFWTASSMALYRLNILVASGLSKAMNFTSNITALMTFAILGNINWLLGLTMGICLMAGAFLGAHSAIRFGSKFIRPIFVTVVSILAVKLAYEAWFVTL